MDWTSGKTRTTICLHSPQINEPNWDLCKTYTACCCHNLSGNSWLWGDLLLLESMNTHHSRLEGIISTCEYIRNPRRQSHSQHVIHFRSNRKEHKCFYELPVQSPLKNRTDLTASHRKNQFSPSLCTCSPQVLIAWFVYMPKHVSFLIPCIALYVTLVGLLNDTTKK